MAIETYSGIMNVKYSLQTKTSSELYKRSDPLHDPADKSMCYLILLLMEGSKRKQQTRNKFVKKKIFQKELSYTAKNNAWT